MKILDPSKLKEFVKENNPKYPWAIGETDSIGTYAVNPNFLIQIKQDDMEIDYSGKTLCQKFKEEHYYLTLTERISTTTFFITYRTDPYPAPGSYLDPGEGELSYTECRLINYERFTENLGIDLRNSWVKYMETGGAKPNLILTYLPIGEYNYESKQFDIPVGTSISNGPIRVPISTPYPRASFAEFIYGAKEKEEDEGTEFGNPIRKWYFRFFTKEENEITKNALRCLWDSNKRHPYEFWRYWKPNFQIEDGFCSWYIEDYLNFDNILVSGIFVIGGNENSIVISGQHLTNDYSGNILYSSMGLETEIIANTENTVTIDGTWDGSYLNNPCFIVPEEQRFIPGTWPDENGYILKISAGGHDPEFSVEAMKNRMRLIFDDKFDHEGIAKDNYINSVAWPVLRYFLESMRENEIISDTCIAVIPETANGKLNTEGKAYGACVDLKVPQRSY